MEETAPPTLIPGPLPDIKVGYTCQTYLSHYLTDNWFKSEFFVYFSRQLNPVNNGESSNPLIIFQWFDTAIKRNDINHPKLVNHRTTLLWVIDRNRREGIVDDVTAGRLAREVADASIGYFCPEIWRLNLELISDDRIQPTNHFPDEYVIPDLRPEEFEVIIDTGREARA